jgi:hypothetical protein
MSANCATNAAPRRRPASGEFSVEHVRGMG